MVTFNKKNYTDSDTIQGNLKYRQFSHVFDGAIKKIIP